MIMLSQRNPNRNAGAGPDRGQPYPPQGIAVRESLPYEITHLMTCRHGELFALVSPVGQTYDPFALLA